MFKKTKSLDQILSSFTQVRDELAQAIVNLKQEKVDKEVNIKVLTVEVQNIEEDMIKAAKSLQKIEEILGE